jgi:hypothetical protein
MYWIIAPLVLCAIVLLVLCFVDIYCKQNTPIEEQEEENMVSVTFYMKKGVNRAAEFRGDDTKYLDELLENLNEKKTGFIKLGDELILNIEDISSIELD